MDTLITYIDDAEYALRIITPMLNSSSKTRWILVACSPRMSRHITKWTTHSARESWTKSWSDKQFALICPALEKSQGHAAGNVLCLVAKGPLPEFTAALRAEHGLARVVDARRPKFGQEMQAVTQGQPNMTARWQLPSVVGSLGAIMALAAE